jgi:hypothetical protein
MVAPPSAFARRKEKTATVAQQPILAGTVFRDAGFAMRGAAVVVTPDPASGRKKAEWRAVSDARGEFLLRLPAGPASYNVVVRANGYKPQEKKVTFASDERLDLNFLLEPGGDNR